MNISNCLAFLLLLAAAVSSISANDGSLASDVLHDGRVSFECFVRQDRRQQRRKAAHSLANLRGTSVR